MPYATPLQHAARLLAVPPSQEALDDALANLAEGFPAGTPGQRAVSLMKNKQTGDLRFMLDFNAADAVRRGDFVRIGPAVYCFVDNLTEWSAS